VLQCVAVCCSVLQCVCFNQGLCMQSDPALTLTRRVGFDFMHKPRLKHTRCNTLQHTEIRCNTLKHSATHKSKPTLLVSVALCCRVFQGVAGCCRCTNLHCNTHSATNVPFLLHLLHGVETYSFCEWYPCVAVCCRVLRCVAVCCSVMCVAVGVHEWIQIFFEWY